MAEKRTSTPIDEDQSTPKKSKSITEVLENSEERDLEDTKPSTSNEKVKKRICTTCEKCYAQNKDLLHHQRLKHGSADGKKIARVSSRARLSRLRRVREMFQNP